MDKLKKVNIKLKIALIAVVVFLIVLLFLIPTFVKLGDKATATEGGLFLTEYNPVTNSSILLTQLVFSKDAAGRVTLQFFDEEDKLLSTETAFFNAENLSATHVFVLSGLPASYKIVAADLSTYAVRVVRKVFYTLGIIAAVFALLWTPFKSKSTVINGKKVRVICGLFKNYYTIDGIHYEKFAKFFAVENLIIDVDGTEVIIGIDSKKHISFLENRNFSADNVESNEGDVALNCAEKSDNSEKNDNAESADSDEKSGADE